MKLPIVLPLALVLGVSSASAQSVFVAVVGGAESMLTPRFEIAGEPVVEGGGTAPFVGARVGIAIGTNWGVELEAIQNFGAKQAQGSGGIPIPLTTVGSITGSFHVGPTTVETETRVMTWTPSLWLGHAFSERVGLVVLGGAAFTRTVVDQDIRFPDFQLPSRLIPSGLFPIDLGILSTTLLPVQSTRAISYDVAPMVGADVPLSFGDHVRVAPGVRLSGRGGSWTVRPAVSVGWQF
jgi:hypothetical protein